MFPWLRFFLMVAVIFGAGLFAPPLAIAQSSPTDSGEFQEGGGSSPPNQDSEMVPGLSMGLPIHAGTGCPQGTMSASLSPDQKALSLLFDAYVIRVGGDPASPPRAQARLDCQIRIPFTVPQGYRVAIVKMDYRGFTSVPQGARSTFGAGFTYLDANGISTKERRILRSKVFVGPRQENFEVSSHIAGPPVSPCGQNFILQAESLLNAQSNAQGEEVITSIDSLDTAMQPVIYSLKWMRCQGGTPPAQPNPPSRPERPPRQPPLPPGVHPPAKPIPCPPARPHCRQIR